MTSKLPEEVVKVHEKSLLLLDKSNQKIKEIQEMLRKAVVRLSIAARGSDEQLDQVLEHIKSSVKNNIDLDQLDALLDSLLVHMNYVDNDETLTSAKGSYAYLEDNDQDYTRFKSFANDIIGSLKLDTVVKENAGVGEMLDELTSDIISHVDKIACSSSDARNHMVSSDEISPEYLKDALLELLNYLVLPEDIQVEYHAVIRKLDHPFEEDGQWKAVINNISALINKSINRLQEEKDELQVFIKKTTSQLEEIEEYVRRSRQERIDTASESSMLKDSVDANVDKIQTTVTDSGDIDRLKNVVQVHLTEIRKSVEEHQAAETERENISKQGYAHIIGELARTQKETLMLKEQLQESKKKLLRDPLTELPNRLAFEERIALELNRYKRNYENICIAMWDIDHFKKVNDTYGHDAGDRVLKLLSKIITTRVRKVDMFARIGGEEFVLLMPDTSLDNALLLNDQLRDSLANSGFHYDGSPCPITASVGIARIEEYDNVDSVMRKADEALYTSKREGRNRCTLYPAENNK